MAWDEAANWSFWKVLGSSKPREIYRRVLPGIDTPGFKPKIEWARMLDSEHIAVVVNDRLSVWEITSGEVAYSVDKISSQQLPSLSPGGRFLAIPDGSGVTLINALDGQSLGHIPIDGPVTPCVSFHPDGNRLALCSDNQLVVFDLQSGRSEQEVTLAEHIAGTPIGWVGENLLVSQGGSLIDTELGLVVWNYTIGGSRNGVGMPGAVLVFSGTRRASWLRCRSRMRPPSNPSPNSARRATRCFCPPGFDRRSRCASGARC